ncbi:hypothetical protein LX36DRAFT_151645 [Colletotrichum falcatum]|nr:hypothetical protein LX36DRAFT_151645 [Colletotrichum falcatum]
MPSYHISQLFAHPASDVRATHPGHRPSGRQAIVAALVTAQPTDGRLHRSKIMYQGPLTFPHISYNVTRARPAWGIKSPSLRGKPAPQSIHDVLSGPDTATTTTTSGRPLSSPSPSSPRRAWPTFYLPASIRRLIAAKTSPARSPLEPRFLRLPTTSSSHDA